MKVLLTIAIPSYNRPHRVVERLRELLPQCLDSDKVEILVLDNASDEDVESKVLETLPAARDRVRFNRNAGNIGLAGNICRCFEVANGTWVWTLGDDDMVEVGAVQEILGVIFQKSEAPLGGINFSTGIYAYPSEKCFLTLADYCEVMMEPKAFSNALFLSSCVFRRDIFLKYLRSAYLYVASAAPHIAVPVQAMMEGVPFMVAPQKIVKWFPPDISEKWDSLAVAKSLPLLGELGECHPLLRSFVAGYRLHMPGDLNLKVAFKRIFSPLGRQPVYWNVYYSRIAPYLSGADWVRANLCSILAGIAHRVKWVRLVGVWLALHLEVDAYQTGGAMDRL
jgi:glycosyltransferase involved in cell wall biosynthesis